MSRNTTFKHKYGNISNNSTISEASFEIFIQSTSTPKKSAIKVLSSTPTKFYSLMAKSSSTKSKICKTCQFGTLCSNQFQYNNVDLNSLMYSTTKINKTNNNQTSSKSFKIWNI
ncbi:unnamed protein product [Didymodactylos carnosus]|uniref:Uncharacterized protein n=1 Tax=Didymodactylos carnosus TaxID=1234261 RepID=A0A813V5H5_9BILA|nr:unnamed protein product [Didymodactylos carnosus]CAF3624289.1 unnamed protein product [Didymodactylos carnosus]